MNPQNDDEWKDYEEFKKDYTGLKIENLKLDDATSIGDDEETELNEVSILTFLLILSEANDT